MSDEHRAFEELHRSTCRELLTYLRRRSDPDRAADLLAEVYLVAWRRRADLPSGDERRLWLYGVARRVVLQHGRGVPLVDSRAVRSPGWEGTTGDDDAGAPDPRAVAVREALARLRDVDRELITLTAW